MKVSFAALSCRQLRRALLTATRTPLGRPRIILSTQKNFTTAFTADHTFQGFGHTTPEVEPVVDGLSDDDILYQDSNFDKKPIEKRFQSPSNGSAFHHSEIATVEEHYDQDYDEYTLHMSSFQAYNSTRESLPNLDILQPGDVRNLKDVEEYWESHPNAFEEEDLELTIASNEYVPDVKDI